MCFKKSLGRKKLKKLINFLNDNRSWICGGNCIVAPECFYCQLIYQLNYSYIKNESTDIETFENSIFCNAFAHFQELHKKYNEKKKWINYSKSFKTRKGTFTIIKYN